MTSELAKKVAERIRESAKEARAHSCYLDSQILPRLVREWVADEFLAGEFDDLLAPEGRPVLPTDPEDEALVDGLVNDAIRQNNTRTPMRPRMSDETIDVLIDEFFAWAKDSGQRMPATPPEYFEEQAAYAEDWSRKRGEEGLAAAATRNDVARGRRVAAELRAWQAYAEKRKAGQ